MRPAARKWLFANPYFGLPATGLRHRKFDDTMYGTRSGRTREEGTFHFLSLVLLHIVFLCLTKIYQIVLFPLLLKNIYKKVKFRIEDAPTS